MHYVPASFSDPLPTESGRPPDASEEFRQRHPAAPLYLLTVIVGALLGIDLLVGWIDSPLWTPYRTLFGFRLSLLAAVLGGSRILYRTLEGLFEGRVGSDMALTIACLSAIVMGEPTVAALVIFIALCGESIEGFTAWQARRAIGKMISLRPRLAHVIRNGEEIDVPLESVLVGEIVNVRPGERIPVDGAVLEGASTVDQSALTGESWPVDKRPGDSAFTGTLNQFGTLSIAAEKVGAETTFGQIVTIVKDATSRKAPIEATADRLARYFLPAVLGAALLTLVGWRIRSGVWSAGWMPTLSVLVVACPCPLILATPSAVLAALAWLAKTGVVIKGSVALERLALVDSFAFDKTGTLTEGRPTLGDIVPIADVDETEILRIAAAVERRSEHVLARLIVAQAAARNLSLPQVREFVAHAGGGVTAHVPSSALAPSLRRTRSSDTESAADHSASIDTSDENANCQVTVGTQRLLENTGVVLDETTKTRLVTIAESGQTPILVAVGETVLAIIGVRDTVRPDARRMIGELRAAGVQSCTIVTGDRLAPARNVAESIGQIDEVVADMLPLDKERWVRERTSAGKRVAMVGDGVNDAPALVAATVGLALGQVGGNLVAEAGDVILMGDPLAPLPSLLRLSREFVRVVRQSIYIFAFALNAVGVLLSAWGILNPVGAALFHEFGSLAVMLNALRLLWFERWDQTRLGRFAQQSEQAAEWLSQTFSPSRAAFALLDSWQTVLRVAVSLAGIVWFLSNLVLVREDEQALVTRFGRYETTLGAGIHLRWPAPFERIRRVETDRIRTVQIGFRSQGVQEDAEGLYSPPIEWQSEHAAAGYRSVPAEADLLSGDEVPVEVTAELQYRIGDVRRFAYGAANAEALLRAATEASLREVAARMSLDKILTDERAEIESTCLRLVRRKVQDYALGVDLTDLNLLEIHPPTAVVPNYRQVADAMEQREQLINEGETIYSRQLLSVAGEAALAMLQPAVNERKPNQPAANRAGRHAWTLDDATWAQLTRRTSGQSVLSGAAAARLQLAEQDRQASVQAATGDAARFLSLFGAYERNEPLTTFQLYWGAVDASLSAGALTIMDPHAAGRHHVFFGDPERTATLLPATIPPGEAIETEVPDRPLFPRLPTKTDPTERP